MSNIDEKRLFEVKKELGSLLLSAATFGHRGDSFTAINFSDLIDELIIMRIKQALASEKDQGQKNE